VAPAGIPGSPTAPGTSLQQGIILTPFVLRNFSFIKKRTVSNWVTWILISRTLYCIPCAELIYRRFADLILCRDPYRDNLTKQTYSVYVETPNGRKKWHLSECPFLLDLVPASAADLGTSLYFVSFSCHSCLLHARNRALSADYRRHPGAEQSVRSGGQIQERTVGEGPAKGAAPPNVRPRHRPDRLPGGFALAIWSRIRGHCAHSEDSKRLR
jgi:hypothetical protein